MIWHFINILQFVIIVFSECSVAITNCISCSDGSTCTFCEAGFIEIDDGSCQGSVLVLCLLHRSLLNTKGSELP